MSEWAENEVDKAIDREPVKRKSNKVPRRPKDHGTTETIPCETCGNPTVYFGTRRCNCCWEVETRLRTYLVQGGAKAFEFVERVLNDARG